MTMPCPLAALAVQYSNCFLDPVWTGPPDHAPIRIPPAAAHCATLPNRKLKQQATSSLTNIARPRSKRGAPVPRIQTHGEGCNLSQAIRFKGAQGNAIVQGTAVDRSLLGIVHDSGVSCGHRRCACSRPPSGSTGSVLLSPMGVARIELV